MMRQVGYNIWLGGRTKKDQKVSVTDWLPLSTDKKETVHYQPTQEEYDKIMKRMTAVKKAK